MSILSDTTYNNTHMKQNNTTAESIDLKDKIQSKIMLKTVGRSIDTTVAPAPATPAPPPAAAPVAQAPAPQSGPPPDRIKRPSIRLPDADIRRVHDSMRYALNVGENINFTEALRLALRDWDYKTQITLEKINALRQEDGRRKQA